jgi:hypothetical protein
MSRIAPFRGGLAGAPWLRQSAAMFTAPYNPLARRA